MKNNLKKSKLRLSLSFFLLVPLLLVSTFSFSAEPAVISECWIRLQRAVPSYFSSPRTQDSVSLPELHASLPPQIPRGIGTRSEEILRLGHRLDSFLTQRGIARPPLGPDSWLGALNYHTAAERWALALFLDATEQAASRELSEMAALHLGSYLRGFRVIQAADAINLRKTVWYGGGVGVLCGFAAYPLGAPDTGTSLLIGSAAGIFCARISAKMIAKTLPLPTPKNRIVHSSASLAEGVKNLRLPQQSKAGGPSEAQILSNLIGRTLFELTRNEVEVPLDRVIADLQSLLDLFGNTTENREFLVNAYLNLATLNSATQIETYLTLVKALKE